MGTAFGHAESTARTAKVCFWCGEPINAGERYAKWCWVDGRTYENIVCHSECRDAWHTLDFPDNEHVRAHQQCRGCTCERGRCECEKGGEQ